MDKKKQADFIKNTVDKSNYILEDTLLDLEAKLEDNNSFNYDDIVKNTAKARMSKVPWLVSIFLILIVSIYLVFTFLNGNPETIFTKTIDQFFLSITDNISDNNYEISKGKINLKIIADTAEEKEFFDELSKVDFDMDYILNSANDLFKLKVLAKYDEKDFADLDIYNEKGYIYVYAPSIYEKYLKIKNEADFKLISPKDVKVVLNGLNQAFDKVATSEKITGEKVGLDLGNKSINVYETKLVIDEKNYEKVSEMFVNTLKSNGEFISSLGKILEISNKEVQKKLDKLLLKIKKYLLENEKLEIKLYNDRRTKDFIKGIIDGKLITYTLFKNENNFSFDLVNNKNNEKIDGNFIVSLNDKKTEYKFDLNLKHYMENNLEDSLNVKLNFTNTKASSFKKVDTSNSVSFNDLTDLEKFNIYGKIESNEKLNKFLKFIK